VKGAAVVGRFVVSFQERTRDGKIEVAIGRTYRQIHDSLVSEQRQALIDFGPGWTIGFAIVAGIRRLENAAVVGAGEDRVRIGRRQRNRADRYQVACQARPNIAPTVAIKLRVGIGIASGGCFENAARGHVRFPIDW